jgi:transcriptional regulator of arginine metabolism
MYIPVVSMDKQSRHYTIREIIGAKPIASQDDLRRELRKRGCIVTQATLSRDMKDLGVVRMTSDGGSRYTLQPVPSGNTQALRPIVGAEVLGIAANESLIVVHTLPGCANTVGEFIDMQKHEAILGTVAGDNTLLVIPASQRQTKNVVEFLKNKLIRGKE